MVDIHSHILPFVDDGSDSLEMSFEMLKSACEASTTAIVMTPHSNLYDNDKNLLYEMQFVFDAFKQKVQEQGIDIDIYLGAEVFADDNIADLAQRRLVPTVNGSRFMLIEFDFYSSPNYITDTVGALSKMGFVPVIAHPERYECIKKFHSLSMDFMNSGGLLQLNKGSLTGDFGLSARKAAYELINHRTAQFVASDAHSCGVRNTDMELAYDIVADEFDRETADRLFTVNPGVIIENGRLSINRPIAF